MESTEYRWSELKEWKGFCCLVWCGLAAVLCSTYTDGKLVFDQITVYTSSKNEYRIVRKNMEALR